MLLEPLTETSVLAAKYCKMSERTIKKIYEKRTRNIQRKNDCHSKPKKAAGTHKSKAIK
jgi:hypothetical protein